MKFQTTTTRFDNMPRSRRQVLLQLKHARAMRLKYQQTREPLYLRIAQGALAVHSRWRLHMIEQLPV